MESATQKQRPGSLQSVDRALRLLLAFERQDQELGVTELARSLGVHKSTTSRLAATLAARGFLERAPGSEAFRLGPEVGRLGLLALRGWDLVADAEPVMERLAAATGETVNLAIPDGPAAVNLAQADGPHMVGVGSWVGQRTDLHCTANGKVLLAWGVAEPAGGPLRRHTGRTIASREQLERELAGVRGRGWAGTAGELEQGLNVVAAPITDPAGRCCAALSVAGPAYRVPRKRFPELARACCEAAAEIGERIGRST